ncbi:MAG: hypothetical protein AB7O55_32720 [Lautropia sp.]
MEQVTIHDVIFAALSTLPYPVRAKELPRNPKFPHVIFDIRSDPEDNWCFGGGYTQHRVQCFLLSRSLSQISLMTTHVRAALKAVPSWMEFGDHGDGEYEDDPEVFAYYLNAVFRTRDDQP